MIGSLGYAVESGTARNELCRSFSCGSFYSHLKHFTATPIQITVTAPITAAGTQRPPVGRPREVAFIIWMPWVSGKMDTTFLHGARHDLQGQRCVSANDKMKENAEEKM